MSSHSIQRKAPCIPEPVARDNSHLYKNGKSRCKCTHGRNNITKRCIKGTPVRKKKCAHGESTVKTKSGLNRCNKKPKTVKVALTKTTTHSKSIGKKGEKLQADEFICRKKDHSHDLGRVIVDLDSSSYTLKNGRYTLYAYCPTDETIDLHKPTTLEFIKVNEIPLSFPT